MNREGFLAQLTAALGDMPQAERNDVINYFDELIQDKAADRGISEEEVVAELGQAEEIAKSVRASESADAPRSKPLAPGEVGDMVFTAEASQVRNLVLRVDNSRVTVGAGAGEQVEIRYTQSQHNRYTAELKNSELTFRQMKPSGLLAWGISAFLEPAQPVEVTLPREYAGAADLATTNGKIGMEGVSVWGSLKVSTSNGALELTNVSARDITAGTSNGKITAHMVQAQGDVTLSTSNGKVQAQRVSGAKISLRSSNGAIATDHLASGDITLRTSNAAIEGVLDGNASDYTVTSGTSNGKNSLSGHAHTGAKRLSVHTSNGSIRLGFAQDATV